MDPTTAIYDSNPNHLWNRLFATFYVREVEYSDSVPASHPLYPKIWGPNVVDPPLGLHPRFLLEGATFIACRNVLEEFLKSRGPQLISDPLKKAILQRDMWAVFDVLNALPKSQFMGPEDVLPSLTEVQEERRATLAVQVAKVIKALAIPRADLDRLPDTYLLAAKSGAFSNQAVDQKQANYLPSDLEAADSPWIEILPPDKGPRAKEGFFHTENVRGRSVFRVYARPPSDERGAKLFQDWLESMEASLEARLGAASGFYTNGEEWRRWDKIMQEVPARTHFLLLRRMICLDPDLIPVPTRVVESVQVRIFRPSGNRNSAQVFEEFDLDRRLLFEGRQGGMRPIAETEPRPNTYVALGRLSTDSKGRIPHLAEFPRACIDCHSGPFDARGASFTRVLSLSVVGRAARQNEDKVAQRTMQWMKEQEDYKRLLEMAAARQR